MTIFFAVYVLLGLGACVFAACTRDKHGRKHSEILSLIVDPPWLLMLFWPLWLGVILVERSFPPAAPGENAPAIPEPIGQIGTVVAALRPLGKIQIGPSHFDARSAGRALAVGTKVRVLSRSMAELVVEEAAEP